MGILTGEVSLSPETGQGWTCRRHHRLPWIPLNRVLTERGSNDCSESWAKNSFVSELSPPHKYARWTLSTGVLPLTFLVQRLTMWGISVPAVLFFGAFAKSAFAAIASTFTAPAAACVVLRGVLAS